MGCSFSCTTFSSSSKSSKLNNNNIRVVHLDGHIEHFNHPITVAEIAGNPSKHFLFTRVQLLSSCSHPLKFDALLEQGRAYFMLPQSLFESNVSPVDLAPITRKLAAIARSKSKSGVQSVSSSVGGYSYSPVWSSPARSPNRLSSDGISARVRTENDQVLYRSPKSGSWKPILATISEKSLNHRSESDLLNNVKVDCLE